MSDNWLKRGINSMLLAWNWGFAQIAIERECEVISFWKRKNKKKMTEFFV